MNESGYIKATDFSVGYDGKSVVSDINININKGEIVSLVGPNGAGKTTIIKSIVNQLEPIAGVLYLDGQNLSSMSSNEIAKQMSVVFTNRMRAEMLTVREIVESGRYPYTNRLGILGEHDRKIVDEAIELIGIEELQDRDFMKISDGQKQRVLLARAIAQEPEIIVLDEPTSYLDIKYKLEFLSLLYKLSREKKLTVIMSLHEIDLARKVSDKVACFKAGKLDKYGKSSEVLTEEYVSELFDIDLDYVLFSYKLIQ